MFRRIFTFSLHPLLLGLCTVTLFVRWTVTLETSTSFSCYLVLYIPPEIFDLSEPLSKKGSRKSSLYQDDCGTKNRVTTNKVLRLEFLIHFLFLLDTLLFEGEKYGDSNTLKDPVGTLYLCSRINLVTEMMTLSDD